MCRKADAWYNDLSSAPRDPLWAVPRSRNDEDTQPEIGRISHDERRAYRRQILCYNNDKQPASWRIRPTCVDRDVSSAPSCRICSRNTKARSRMFPCASAKVHVHRRFFITM